MDSGLQSYHYGIEQMDSGLQKGPWYRSLTITGENRGDGWTCESLGNFQVINATAMDISGDVHLASEI